MIYQHGHVLNPEAHNCGKNTNTNIAITAIVTIIDIIAPIVIFAFIIITF
jgi:hypothetical protein